MAQFTEKLYDPTSQELHLVYYALPADLINKNGWAVSSSTIDKNIKSFINKPAILKPKDPNNPLDIPQKGNFVHYLIPSGKTAQDGLREQETYAIGRIRDVKLNPKKGYRFDVEITDGKAKQALLASQNDICPKWVSPLVVTTYDEDITNVKNWVGHHLAFVDLPAYGFELSKAAAICSGTAEECNIKLLDASEKQCGFCTGQAMQELLSSQSSPIDKPNNIMSENINSDLNKIEPTKASEQGPKQEGDKTDTSKDQTQRPQGVEPQEISREPKDPDVAPLPATYDEAIRELKESRATTENQKSLLERMLKEQATVNKVIQELQKKERYAVLRNLIPRDNFKTEKSYQEELDEAYKWNLPDEKIREYYELKFRTAPLLQKGASEYDRYESYKSVPQFYGSESASEPRKQESHSSDNLMKTYKLVKLLSGGSV